MTYLQVPFSWKKCIGFFFSISSKTQILFLFDAAFLSETRYSLTRVSGFCILLETL